MFGGGGLNPRKMEQMMEQMGIDADEIEATEAIIRTADGEELVFEDPDVTKVDARGQQTFQIVGDFDTRDIGAGEGASGDAGSTGDSDADGAGNSDAADDAGIPDADIEIVAERTGSSRDDAREALEAADGDLAAAIDSLE